MDAVPVNWEDVPRREIEVGPIAGTWRDLGVAAGTRQVGLRRMQLPAGMRSTPAHTHSGEEEVFFVLAGSGLSWQGGETYEVAAGDCLVHLIEGPAHTLVAGPDGLDCLVFSDRCVSEACYLPRAQVAWLGSSWVKAGDTPHPYAQEVAAGELELPERPSARPPSIVNLEAVEALAVARGDCASTRRSVSAEAGAVRTALRHFELAAGKLGVPPHAHSGAEELFVVLEGDGVYLEGAPGASGWSRRSARSGPATSSPSSPAPAPRTRSAPAAPA